MTLSAAGAPRLPLAALDQLWFQLTGTLCNLSCGHCFISCNPGNHSFGFLSEGEVLARLGEAERLGVRELYFTGGEPFLHPRLLAILQAALRIAPATVLTNATILRPETAEELAALAAASRYSLEIRVSIDGPDAASNDPIRGPGAFERAMEGLRSLARAGLLPILTAVVTWDERETPGKLRAFERAMREAGCARPRVKLIPTLRLGMEEARTRGYLGEERVTEPMLEGHDLDQFLCRRARIVTDRGVAVCPILIEAEGAHLGKTLEEALVPVSLSHSACFTCWQHGAICSNVGSVGEG